MIDKIGANQGSVPLPVGVESIRDTTESANLRTKQTELASVGNAGPSGNPPDASLQVDHGALIERAKSTEADPRADAEAVMEARELLLSGQLETPENIRSAAESIVRLGV